MLVVMLDAALPKRGATAASADKDDVPMSEEERTKQKEHLRNVFQKTKMCPWLAGDRCVRADRCNFAHSESELRPRPDYQDIEVDPRYWKHNKKQKKNIRRNKALAYSMAPLLAHSSYSSHSSSSTSPSESHLSPSHTHNYTRPPLSPLTDTATTTTTTTTTTTPPLSIANSNGHPDAHRRDMAMTPPPNIEASTTQMQMPPSYHLQHHHQQRAHGDWGEGSAVAPATVSADEPVVATRVQSPCQMVMGSGMAAPMAYLPYMRLSPLAILSAHAFISEQELVLAQPSQYEE
ncbi:unnamed protein product [Vitrella brassicaformis CCMP3155]|uniref:C3H1-type domain-containing protein n=2 Tax=Vitrella brassicaformis TaxID=1169539 RepID=A0A0G4GUY8_VITBC|nr:unnamed protein product [Vitrella brassicaformis CCMP3155]|eukprot:CEM34713.1 unnamed protein product [Vitrella brassicaformis CCMP3155]